MSGTSLLGFDRQFAEHLADVQVPLLTQNLTSVYVPLFLPVGFGRGRIVKVSWAASASLAQAGGTSTVAVSAGLPGALATIVAATTVLGGVADTPVDFSLAAETAAKELTLLEGSIVKVTLAMSNNAFGTNGSLGVQVFWHSIPKESAGDDIKHAAFYINP